MKKSHLKQLIREVIEEVQAGRIDASERRKIANELHKYPVLQGNEKVHKPSEALKYITKALNDAGFQLNMVTGDILLGDKGQRLLSFSRAPNPMYVSPEMALDAGDRSMAGSLYSGSEEGEEITNSRISFAWEVTSVSPTNSLEKKFEIVAYVT